MDCPACKVPLIVAERDGVELDVCVQCHGLWLDAGELALLAEKMGRRLEAGGQAGLVKAEVEESTRPCPRCDKRMHKAWLGNRPRVLLDTCPAGHGLWFDAGELGQVLSQFDVAAGSQPAAVIAFMGERIKRGEEQ
jgi:Zn-finger nucleic acid-binding protein